MEYKIVDKDIDGENNWYYYPSGIDHGWNIIEGCWLNHCKDKYFKYVKNKRVMVTCGAHIGMYARFYEKEFDRVYAFEPHPFHFFCLTNNVSSDKVIKIQSAVGNENKLINLYETGGNGHLTLGVNKTDHDNAFIPMIKIDDLNLPVCDLLQIDVEYFEYEALTGAIETIKRCSPVIIAENGDTPEIKLLLGSLDYTIIDTTDYDTIWVKNEKI